MPNYLFQKPNTKIVKEIFQHMAEDHVYSEDGIEWKREWTLPQASFDSNWDHNNSRNFIEQTAKKKGTMGDLWSKSHELSEKRKEERGIDPLKEKAYSDYQKNCNKPHPQKAKPIGKYWE